MADARATGPRLRRCSLEATSRHARHTNVSVSVRMMGHAGTPTRAHESHLPPPGAGLSSADVTSTADRRALRANDMAGDLRCWDSRTSNTPSPASPLFLRRRRELDEPRASGLVGSSAFVDTVCHHKRTPGVWREQGTAPRTNARVNSQVERLACALDGASCPSRSASLVRMTAPGRASAWLAPSPRPSRSPTGRGW